MEPRVILDPIRPENFPDHPALPEGCRSVRWQDTFGFGVAFKPGIVYADRNGTPLHIHYLTPRNSRSDNPLIVFVLLGGTLIFLAVCRPARQTMERKFFI